MFRPNSHLAHVSLNALIEQGHISVSQDAEGVRIVYNRTK